MSAWRLLSFLSVLVLSVNSACATSNYQYGSDEYVTIAQGISPDERFAVTAHGSGDLGYDNFHLYFTDAVTGKNIDLLKEVVETLDTGADAFSAKWSSNAREVTILYRVDRHAPLKAVSYRITGQRAHWIKGPFDVKSEELIKFWQAYSSEAKASPKIFGTPIKHD